MSPPNVNTGSSIVTVVELTVVAVPFTVRSPATIKLLLVVTVPAFRDIVSITKLVVGLPILIDPDFIPFAARSSSSTFADKNV